MVVALGPLAPPIVLLGADQIALGVSLASAGNGREVTALRGPWAGIPTVLSGAPRQAGVADTVGWWDLFGGSSVQR